MKLRYYLLSVILGFSACSKSTSDEVGGSGCIEQVAVAPTEHEISAANYTKATSLFQQNNISLTNLRITRFLEDDIVLNGVTNHHVNVSVTQYQNTLPFFTGTIIYAFKNGRLNFTGGEKLTTDISATPTLSLAAVRSLYFDEFRKYSQQGSYLKVEDFLNKCLTAELGYYNYRGVGMPNKTVRAWHILPKGKSYPEAYIADSDGSTIYFFDGVVSAGPK
ncbi:hypothetical protein [Hymenobacter cavernae]|nr:hypothetical protein [Hymenobacter cavernae]